MTTIADLERRVSDFRDKQITHEHSPRTMAGTIWGGGSPARIALSRIFPRENELGQQVESEPLDQLRKAIDEYIEQIISFLEANASKTRLKLAEKAAV